MSDMNNKNRVFDENVVMFPASKNYPVESSQVDDLDDPLEALLNEFNDVIDNDYAHDLEEELEEIAREKIAAENKSLSELALMDHRELCENIKDQMKILKETQQRMAHLLKEIDSYMPGKK